LAPMIKPWFSFFLTTIIHTSYQARGK
jgi:hypothetical protein